MKNKMGRSGRRRKAKLKDIQAAEERIWSGETMLEVAPTTASVPTDRDKVWPGVLERRGNEGLSSVDEACVIGQIGYLPGNAICVVARARQVPLLPVDDSVPIVLKLYPLAIRDVHAGGKCGRRFKGRRRGKNNDESSPCLDDASTSDPKDAATDKEDLPLLEPFPTQYWLTHPILRTLVSKLELTDHVALMEQRLQYESNALESMKRAHQAYGQERWENLTNDDLELIKKRKWEPALDARRGVAGTTKPVRIKCLHTHLAHYLSGGRGSEDNIVGKWVFESIIKTLQEKKAPPDVENSQQGESVNDNER
jgi:hypothetical protein